VLQPHSENITQKEIFDDFKRIFFIENALPHWAICDVFVRVAMQLLWRLSCLYLLPCIGCNNWQEQFLLICFFCTIDRSEKRGRGGCCAPFADSWDRVAGDEVYFRNNWRLHPSSRLATIDMGQKLGGSACAVFLGVAGSLSNTTSPGSRQGLPPYQVAS